MEGPGLFLQGLAVYGPNGSLLPGASSCKLQKPNARACTEAGSHMTAQAEQASGRLHGLHMAP